MNEKKCINAGRVFDPNNLPSFMRNKSPEQRKAWADKETTRYTIVKRCVYCQRELIAEEVMAHETAHLNFHIRSYVRTLLVLSPELRAEILATVKELEK